MTEGEGSNGRKWEIRVAKQSAQVDESVSSLSEIESEDAYSHCSSNNTGEDSTHGHHLMVNTKIRLIISFSQRWRSSIQSAKTRPGADCGSDHELLIAKFRSKLQKVGKPLDHSGMT